MSLFSYLYIKICTRLVRDSTGHYFVNYSLCTNVNLGNNNNNNDDDNDNNNNNMISYLYQFFFKKKSESEENKKGKSICLIVLRYFQLYFSYIGIVIVYLAIFTGKN